MVRIRVVILQKRVSRRLHPLVSRSALLAKLKEKSRAAAGKWSASAVNEPFAVNKPYRYRTEGNATE
jgi:hypothetical protein